MGYLLSAQKSLAYDARLSNMHGMLLKTNHVHKGSG